ncbi:hypothetical protein SBOR_5689 [Sclerotinia borealis F-4128]|uniref:Uncharacterized protein n=1 Tax=Sclerotinia borealis (strain F-4128) TaxID=1432307 RepID=W9CHC3_SCLBF|nr:hypothetical protein SBOR_5689 [Sclerotinia borealis F-4128]
MVTWKTEFEERVEEDNRLALLMNAMAREIAQRQRDGEPELEPGIGGEEDEGDDGDDGDDEGWWEDPF